MEIYPLKINEQLKQQFGEHYRRIKKAFQEGNIEEFVEDLFKNPLTNSNYNTVTDEQISSSTQRFIGIFEWLKTKQIYKFDADLWELIQNVEKLEIRSSVFQTLPFQSFWIDHEFENNLNGCMVIYGEYNGENYLKLIFIADDNMSYLCLPFRSEIEGKTIEDLIAEHSNSDVPIWYKNNLRAVLNAIIYLCTEMPDISTRSVDMPNQAQPKSKNKDKKRNSKKNKLNISNVGTKIGRIIRDTRNVSANRNSASVGTGGVGTQKSPHMRRAHYHSYWIGKGEERKLIVKFLSPMLIHGHDAEEKSIPTIRKKSIK